ncbi:hypothetical protein GN958_ATG08278 [Phytophthora infestans]|uniref:Ubiquitin-like protease family profile domain-containing protein n=1 Tax=Phytophthora infestans TaxID=4787 RepID=A0A8S9USH3_PHYIN|nr:hypothetical protein GN958_ATG08278 [Phytophthora infestans]
MLLDTLFWARPNVVTIKPTSLSVVVDGSVSTNTKDRAKLFLGMTNEIILQPINCNGVHWCRIMVWLNRCEIGMYDLIYHCGVLVMAAFDTFCGANAPGKGRKNLIQYLAYIYMCMCFNI